MMEEKALMINQNFVNELQKITQTNQFKQMSKKDQNDILKYALQKNIDLSFEQKEMFLKQLSSNSDVDIFVNFVAEQMRVFQDSKHISHSSINTKTSTGQIKSSVTYGSAGCLLQTILIMLSIFVCLFMIM